MKLPVTAIIIIAVAVMVVMVIGMFFMQGSDAKFGDQTMIQKGCLKFTGKGMTSGEIAREDPDFVKACKSLYGLEPKECTVKWCKDTFEGDACKLLCNLLGGIKRADMCEEFKASNPSRYSSCDCSKIMTKC
ncbi:MAG: hypothetical protein HZB67_01575 [Candidatus Aenigmarchaeota archaeon]|nr:hypothetical protein [Candidatus Aenigmarchaeota archaeon]